MGEGMLGFGAAEGQALALSLLSFKPAFFVPEAATHPPPAQWCTLASTATVSDSMHLSNQQFFLFPDLMCRISRVFQQARVCRVCARVCM